MPENHNETTQDIIKQTAAEPFIEFPDRVMKTRRNLLVCCLLSFAVFMGGQLGTNPSAMGLNIKGLPLNYFPMVLWVVTLYFEVYFAWSGWQTYWRWRLRRTVLSELEKMATGRTSSGITSDYAMSQHTALPQLFKDWGKYDKKGLVISKRTIEFEEIDLGIEGQERAQKHWYNL
ncbi:hypothetical protein [uncultured Pseudodesulfovibrio sp.]|uniref:hypothetical protein n=1 Tax=uncultured Pseudodesulfovibrio sp. TaxID=2035858 RepID=UPI0029C65202|nr:hypothetical protein [uncultured Pseudodesulfovibrio sp.]